jgi:hypothetical protein
MRLTMTGWWNRAIGATTMFTMASGSLGCGYILYPERRGTLSGVIDSGTMVMDLLWLLPGIIPGVIALIVDFSSGAIYVHGKTAIRLSPGGRLAVRLPRSSQPAALELRVVTASHRVVARKTASIGPSTPQGQSIDLEVSDSARRSLTKGGSGFSEALYLEVHTASGASARLPTSIELAPGA